jgi:hypothetical protein
MLAATNKAQADGGREWIELLRTHNVRYIEELPENLLRERLVGGAAA